MGHRPTQGSVVDFQITYDINTMCVCVCVEWDISDAASDRPALSTETLTPLPSPSSTGRKKVRTTLVRGVYQVSGGEENGAWRGQGISKQCQTKKEKKTKKNTRNTR